MNKYTFVLLFFLILTLTSCKTKEKVSELNYMQNVEQVATETSMKSALNTIQKGDQLVIFVSAENMEVVKPFNNAEKVYLVDSDGNIDFPVLGKLSVEGKTLEEFRREFTGDLTQYIKNPTVSVKLANFKVTFLGEVARPGQVSVPEGQTTLLNALGLVGDVTMHAKRDDILLVRNVNGTIEKARINLMDANFINSPYFHLKQNDVIYVSANQNKEKIARQDPNTGIYMAVAGMVIGLAGIFITIFKN